MILNACHLTIYDWEMNLCDVNDCLFRVNHCLFQDSHLQGLYLLVICSSLVAPFTNLTIGHICNQARKVFQLIKLGDRGIVYAHHQWHVCLCKQKPFNPKGEVGWTANIVHFKRQRIWKHTGKESSIAKSKQLGLMLNRGAESLFWRWHVTHEIKAAQRIYLWSMLGRFPIGPS